MTSATLCYAFIVLVWLSGEAMGRDVFLDTADVGASPDCLSYASRCVWTKLEALLQSGDVVHFEAGTYNDTITPVVAVDANIVVNGRVHFRLLIASKPQPAQDVSFVVITVTDSTIYYPENVSISLDSTFRAAWPSVGLAPNQTSPDLFSVVTGAPPPLPPVDPPVEAPVASPMATKAPATSPAVNIPDLAPKVPELASSASPFSVPAFIASLVVLIITVLA